MAPPAPPEPVRVRRGHALRGSFTPPGDKSITHRAVLFALLAEGETRISHANPGEDCAASCDAAIALGADLLHEAGVIHVRGTGGMLRPASQPIDCGNSGTSMRLLAGLAARLAAPTRLIGDASLSRRPMRRIAEPLTRMGARVEGVGESLCAPLTVQGGALTGITHTSEVASAQVATCVLLAGLAAHGRTEVVLPGPARDHTERMLPAFGATLDVQPLADGGRRVRLAGGQRLRAIDIAVAGDASAAAFLLAAAAATPDAEVTARGMNLNPTRAGLLRVLEAMGAEVSLSPRPDQAGEPVGDVTVRGPRHLRAFDVPAAWAPTLIDEVPAWVVAATAAEGISRVHGAAELRVKESDRIATLVDGLSACGLEAHAHADGLSVRGGSPMGGFVRTHLDHRIAMAFAALGARSEAAIELDDAACIRTSFPGFLAVLHTLGVHVEGEAA